MQNISTAYDFPLNTLWIVCWLIAAAVVGLIVYNRGNNNLTMAIIGSLVMLMVGMVGGILGFEMIAIIAGLIIMIVVIAGRF
jgi:ABC-type multidrug transport system permease subunit